MTTATRRRAEQHGRAAEDLCVDWLKRAGWDILARGYVVGRGSGAGQVDVVARRGPLIAFVEVKARASHAAAAFAITRRQQARIAHAAEAYLAAHPALAALDVRFDAMLVAAGGEIEHVEDAWRVE